MIIKKFTIINIFKKKCKKICICQKFFVSLHRNSKKELLNIYKSLKKFTIMISTKSVRPIWRVEYHDDESNLRFASVFFQLKKDALSFANSFSYFGCYCRVRKYWLNL